MRGLRRAREAVALGPRVLLAKAVRKLSDLWVVRREGERLRNTSTYGDPEPLRGFPSYLLNLDPDARMSPSDVQAVDAAVRHEFDLLGSGPVRLSYGAACPGFLGTRIEPSKLDPSGRGREALLPPGARAEATRLIGEISQSYTPIDWQLDFRTGYRFSESLPSRQIAIPSDAGIDIKVPWELGRLQHLPGMALRARELPAEAQASLAQEIQDQILDFIAMNPPQFGVQWRCAMDVGIRVANLCLTLDLLRAGTGQVSEILERETSRSVRAHARFLAANLEWYGGQRGNHYLADLCGLLWAGAYLPEDAESDALLAFAIRAFTGEVEHQFLPDGGNFEGSSAYHRLSLEMCLWSAALAQRVLEDREDDLRRADLAEIRIPVAILNATPVDLALPNPSALQRMVDFLEALTKPSGALTLLGDCDSGRFVSLRPGWFRGDSRDTGETLEVGHVLLGAAPLTTSGAVVSALQGRQSPRLRFAASMPRHVRVGRLDRLWQDHSDAGRHSVQHYRVRLGDGCWEGARMLWFDRFSVFIWRSPRVFLSVRCGKNNWDGRGGHAHNDALALELEVDGEPRITDPGTACYLPNLELRDRYRSVRAHCAPWIEADGLVPPEPNPLDRGAFTLPDRCRAETLYAGPDGFAGRHQGYLTPVTRLIRILPDGFELLDAWVPQQNLRLARLPLDETGVFTSPIPVAKRYGEVS